MPFSILSQSMPSRVSETSSSLSHSPGPKNVLVILTHVLFPAFSALPFPVGQEFSKAAVSRLCMYPL